MKREDTQEPKSVKDLINATVGKLSGLELASVKHFAETGKISGSLFIALNQLVELSRVSGEPPKPDLLAYIESLETGFEGWSDDAERGYLTATTSIKEFISKR